MSEIKHGLKENWKQFTLLIFINALVGGMIGMERSIFPQYASSVFGLTSNTVILTFVMAFGFTKAITNYFAGRFSNLLGRKNLLLLGWIFAIPVPFLLIFANHWNWVIFANILLGISQGLTWSSTIIMKIDLVGEKQRGLAMGFNEFSGYISVGLVAFLSGYFATQYGITPYPFYIGIIISITGFFTTLIWVKDTKEFINKEKTTSSIQTIEKVFLTTSFRDKTLSSVTQAGLINNLNDGMMWGLFPILLFSLQYNYKSIGIITAIYPMVWGIGQLYTGKMADQFNKKSILFWGMFIQGLSIILLPILNSYAAFIGLSIFLGIGTAMVYPTFLVTIAEKTNPTQRAESIGVFRLWRDLGYVFGALLSGLTADIFGIKTAIIFTGILTLCSSGIIQWRMPK